jgi:ATP-dependent protease ClpP protease subunit
LATNAPPKPGNRHLNAEVRHLWERRARLLSDRQHAEGVKPRDWYRIQNATSADDEADIYLYDVIGGFWGVSAADFVHELRKITADKINLHLNSPGGDAWDGIAIYNALRDAEAEITVRVDSLAASAASVIAMAGDTVIMGRSSTLMIHDPWAMVIGNETDMRKEADVLNKLGDAIASVYADRANGEVTEWRDLMREETWYTDQEAVDAGLADEVASSSSATDRGARHFDLSAFKHPPRIDPPAPPAPAAPAASVPPPAAPVADPIVDPARAEARRELEAALAKVRL